VSGRTPFGLRAHDHGRTDAAALAARIKAAGASHAQLAPSKAIEGIGPEPGALNEDASRGIAAAFATSDIRVSVLGCYVDLLDPDPAKRDAARERFLESLRRGPIFKAGLVGTESFGRTERGDEGFARLLRALEPIADLSEWLGQDFALEPVFDHVLDGPSRMAAALASIGSERFRVILDPVNLIDPREPEAAMATVAECFERFAPRIRALHLKDFVVEGGALSVVPPGMGFFPFDAFFSICASHGLRCPAILENCPPQEVPRALSFLEEEGLGEVSE
jgi:sugar phosphate isomerase/epimerase